MARKKSETQRKGQQGPNPSALSEAIAAFDIDAAKLDPAIAEITLTDGGHPYDKKLKREPYESELNVLQIELLKLQRHVQATGARIVCLFEGRDAAGKGGCIGRFLEHLNPRHARSVALTKPTEAERGQWYFQRYLCHLPTAGDIVLFDRSWYNRAGVERVMGFSSEDQIADFLREAPQLESLLVRDGIHFFKFFLKIGRTTQIQRFHERRHDPLKTWKLSDIDLAAIGKWDAYSQAYDDMFRFTDTATTPWTVVWANDQRRARLETIRTVLAAIEYEGKNEDVVRVPDPALVGRGPDFFVTRGPDGS